MSKVVMLELRFGYFPHRFQLNGAEHQVKQVERTQTSHRELSFVVWTTELERYRLTQNQRNKEWKCRKV